MLLGNSLRQTVHTHCASVHQAAKLVAALLRVAWVTAGLAESNALEVRGSALEVFLNDMRYINPRFTYLLTYLLMAAYRRLYDSRHLQADCQEPGSAPEPYAR